MTIYDVTGYQYPDNWIVSYEVCDDRGYGAKVGEFENLIASTVEEEMRAVTSGLRAAEPHHTHLKSIGDKIEEDNSALPEHWMENLMDYIKEVNDYCFTRGFTNGL